MNIEITDADVLRMADLILALRYMENNMRPKKTTAMEVVVNGYGCSFEGSLAWKFKTQFDDVLETHYEEVNTSNKKAYDAIKARLRAIADGCECGTNKGATK